MKIFAVALFAGLMAVAYADSSANVCFNSFTTAIKDNSINSDNLVLATCSALTPEFNLHENTLQQFASLHFEISYKYMLLAAQFKSYIKDRPGFNAKFQGLSDRSFKAGIDMIKYITKRGGKYEFQTNTQFPTELADGVVDLPETEAMALVLDLEKRLFEQARLVHLQATHKKHNHTGAYYDPEIAHFIEEEHLESLSESVRKFSGYANDLKNLHRNGGKAQDMGMTFYLYDNYLQKA